MERTPVAGEADGWVVDHVAVVVSNDSTTIASLSLLQPPFLHHLLTLSLGLAIITAKNGRHAPLKTRITPQTPSHR
jgi:hypothetical protein